MNGQTSGLSLHSPLPLQSPTALEQYCLPPFLHCALVEQPLAGMAAGADAASAIHSGASRLATSTLSAQASSCCSQERSGASAASALPSPPHPIHPTIRNGTIRIRDLRQRVCIAHLQHQAARSPADLRPSAHPASGCQGGLGANLQPFSHCVKLARAADRNTRVRPRAG